MSFAIAITDWISAGSTCVLAALTLGYLLVTRRLAKAAVEQAQAAAQQADAASAQARFARRPQLVRATAVDVGASEPQVRIGNPTASLSLPLINVGAGAACIERVVLDLPDRPEGSVIPGILVSGATGHVQASIRRPSRAWHALEQARRQGEPHPGILLTVVYSDVTRSELHETAVVVRESDNGWGAYDPTGETGADEDRPRPAER
jgi:hypothetical protein